MSFEDQFEPMLEGYRVEWESGVYRSVIDAFELCALNGLPMPEWLQQAIMDELLFAYEHRQRPEGHKGQVQDASNYKHRRRHQLVAALIRQQEWEIEVKLRDVAVNETEAGKVAERILRERQDEARGSRRAIMESYNLLESRYKKL